MAVIMIRVVVPRVIVAGVRVESRGGWCGRLLMTVRLVDVGVGVCWVIIAERDAFKIAGRTANGVCLAERDIVRWLTLKNEISGKMCRERLMSAEPYNERAVDHLYGAIFCGSFYVFVNFTSS
jgi:hypothetical protein